MATVQVMWVAPGAKANGLSADVDGLWVCDQVDNRVFKISYSNGQVLTWFYSPARNMSGIGFGGGAVWAAANVTPSTIYKHNPFTGHCLQPLVLPIGETHGGVHGIEWHEGFLWATRPGNFSIQKVDTETGQLLHEIPFPARRSHGLYFEGDTLVCVETNNHVVYRLDVRDGKVLDQYTIDGFEPHGMTKGPDGRIWLCDAGTNRIGVVQL